jgi:hypothetical protein
VSPNLHFSGLSFVLRAAKIVTHTVWPRSEDYEPSTDWFVHRASEYLFLISHGLSFVRRAANLL